MASIDELQEHFTRHLPAKVAVPATARRAFQEGESRAKTTILHPAHIFEGIGDTYGYPLAGAARTGE